MLYHLNLTKSFTAESKVRVNSFEKHSIKHAVQVPAPTHKQIHNNNKIKKKTSSHLKAKRVKANFCAESTLSIKRNINSYFLFSFVLLLSNPISLPEHFAMPWTFSTCFHLGTAQKRFAVEWGSKDGPQVTYLSQPLEKSSNKQMQPVSLNCWQDYHKSYKQTSLICQLSWVLREPGDSVSELSCCADIWVLLLIPILNCLCCRTEFSTAAIICTVLRDTIVSIPPLNLLRVKRKILPFITNIWIVYLLFTV